jgi:hypothetical protein
MSTAFAVVLLMGAKSHGSHAFDEIQIHRISSPAWAENGLDARPRKFYSVPIQTLIGTTRQPGRKLLIRRSDQRLDQFLRCRLHPARNFCRLVRPLDNVRLIPYTPDGGQILF